MTKLQSEADQNDYLGTREKRDAYFAAALLEGDAAFISKARLDIALAAAREAKLRRRRVIPRVAIGLIAFGAVLMVLLP